MLNYAVVRTDNMAGTDVRSLLVSVKYFVADNSDLVPTAIENGHVVKLDGLLENEREIHKGLDVAANTPINEVVLIASPELIYSDIYKELDDFRNEANTICRGYRFHSGDFFGVTANALTGVSENTAAGDVVELAAGTKLKVVASATSGSTVVGKIHAIETVGKYTYYVVEVA